MKTKILATYLPQFHRIEENSRWWGPGFTEWTNVAKARPLFPGHYQPHIPADLGFYDLSMPETMREQASLARDYGIDGFNFYFYWFSGKRILERPLENYLGSNIDFDFSICWANENWTRKWDGGSKEVLLEQRYEDGFEKRLFADLLPYLRDPRYIRIDGKPILSIYKPQELPDPHKSLEQLRRFATQSGLGGLHIIAVETAGLETPSQIGADALMEFPPVGIPPEAALFNPKGSQPDFSGQFWDYPRLVNYAMSKPEKNFLYYRGVMPSWDNSPRVGSAANVFLNTSPDLFRLWLEYALSWGTTKTFGQSQPLVFINAWNEWAEGAHLEPDLKDGRRWLEAVRDAKKMEITTLEECETRIKQGIFILGNASSKDEQISHRRTSVVRVLLALFRHLNMNSFMHVKRVWLDDKTGRKLFVSVRSALIEVLKAGNPVWKPQTYLKENTEVNAGWESKVLITCHLYHEEYTQRFVSLIQSYPARLQFLVTTPKPEIKQALDGLGLGNLRVILSKNQGRNFGPLLVEAASEMRKFEYVVHLHSKRSSHSSLTFARAWADAHWRSLGENSKTLIRFIGLFESTPDLAIGYPLVTDIIPLRDFGWNGNHEQAQQWHERNAVQMLRDPIPFPAGGMFIIRTSAFGNLLEHDWTYEEFPAEGGQLDGTTQHLVERVFGTLPISLGWRHAVFIEKEDKFTDDVSYVLS